MKKNFPILLFILFIGGLAFLANCTYSEDTEYNIVGNWSVSGNFSTAVVAGNAKSIPVPSFDKEEWRFTGTMYSGSVETWRWKGTYAFTCESPCTIKINFDNGLIITGQFADENNWSGNFSGTFNGSPVQQGEVSATRN